MISVDVSKNPRLSNMEPPWRLVMLKDISEVNPRLPNNEDIDNDLEVQFLPMRLVEELTGKIHLTETRKYKEVKKGYTPFVNGDVIFAKVTPCMENGKIAMVENLKNGIGFGSSEFHVIRSKGTLLSKYAFYYLIQQKFRREAENQMTGAVGLRRVPKQFLENATIPFPTIEEQKEVVSKIEELYSELDKSIEQLKTTQQQLKIYRQSVLKRAFEGRLTNEDLKDGELPHGWQVRKLGEILDVLTDYHANGSYLKLKENVVLIDEPNHAVMIRATNFEKNDFTKNLKYISEGAYNFLSKSKLYGEEILIGKIGNAGKVYFMPRLNRPASLAMNLFALRFNKNVISKYIYYHLLSHSSDAQIKSLVKGVGNPTIDKKAIRSINIMLPSKEEQELVIQEIENRFSVIEKLEETISSSLQTAEALRQSILKKAFERKL